eukprot:4860292-Prymnesium_polylepis.1
MHFIKQLDVYMRCKESDFGHHLTCCCHCEMDVATSHAHFDAAFALDLVSVDTGVVTANDGRGAVQMHALDLGQLMKYDIRTGRWDAHYHLRCRVLYACLADVCA